MLLFLIYLLSSLQVCLLNHNSTAIAYTVVVFYIDTYPYIQTDVKLLLLVSFMSFILSNVMFVNGAHVFSMSQLNYA